MLVSDFLATGEENAKTSKELCYLLHVDKRTLTAAIERERRDGKPICASCSTETPGYYLAGDRETMQRYCDSLHHRAAEIYATRQACLQTLERLPEKGA